jgi:Fe-S cluster biogenesis protein NfuA
MTENKEFQARADRIDALVKRVHELRDANARTTALELLQEVMDMHAAVLQRMMDMTSQAGEPGERLIDKFARDPLVSGLLVLYDLHPDDVETRVTRALEKIRPYLHSHGGDVELINIKDGVVNLRLNGSCHGCQSSAETMKSSVEQAIYEAAPEVATVVADGMAEPEPHNTPGFVPITKLQGAA